MRSLSLGRGATLHDADVSLSRVTSSVRWGDPPTGPRWPKELRFPTSDSTPARTVPHCVNRLFPSASWTWTGRTRAWCRHVPLCSRRCHSPRVGGSPRAPSAPGTVLTTAWQ